MKYNELQKENKTLTRKISLIQEANDKLLLDNRALREEIYNLKCNITQLKMTNDRLNKEIKLNENPLSEVIRIGKQLGVM